MFDKDSWIRLTYSVLAAMIITMIALIFTTQYKDVVFTIWKGMIAGAVIWLLGELLFPLCEKIYPNSIIPGYVMLFLLIFLGTFGFAYILGVKELLILFILCAAAEINGIGITIIYRRKYMKQLNENLERSKNRLD